MNQRNKNDNKEPVKSSAELAGEIDRTRSAISDDIKVLGDRFSPANLKEEAKDMAVQAIGGVKDSAVESLMEKKDAAVDKAVEVKDVVVDKAIEAKDVVVDKATEVKDVVVEKAIEAKDVAVEMAREAKDATLQTAHEVQEVVSETLDDVGDMAGRAARATWRFTVANAAPLALLSVGAGWMIANARKPDRRDVGYDGRLLGTYDDEVAWDRPTYPVGEPLASRAVAPAELRSDFDRAARKRGEGVPHARANVSMRGKPKQERPSRQEGSLVRAEQAVSKTAARTRDSAKQTYRRARDASRDFASDNPMAVGLATVVAGIGIGLLLPRTAREDKLLAPTRDRVERFVDDARDAAVDVSEVARDTARETANALG